MAGRSAVSIDITLNGTALHEAIEWHVERKRLHNGCFSVVKPILGISSNTKTMSPVSERLMWRISDLGEGWLAGVLSTNNDPELTELLGVPNPQTIYPTLSLLERNPAATVNDTISVSTELMLGTWGRNMDLFIVAQEVTKEFTHGWGEPIVKHFSDIADGVYDRYL